MNCVNSAHGANAIRYGLTKREKVDRNEALKQNENVIYLRSDNLKVDSMLGTPDPSDVYQQMKLRQEAAGFRRKYGFWRIEICPSKEDWEKLLGFKPVPGQLTDEQKARITEVANQLVSDSVEKLDQTDHWGYRHNSKKEKYACVTGERSKIGRSQSVWSIHIDTDDIHIHGVANVVTEDNEIQDTNKCRDRGFQAGDKVAEKYKLKVLSQYDNQRKEKIHADGIEVLKGMKEFDLQKYFGEMIAKGWIVEPNSPDRNGVIHGYSIGQQLYHNDKTPSSVVMFQSSKLGHSKDLTPTHLLDTWKKLHAAEQQAVSREDNRRPEQPKQQTAVNVPIAHDKPGRWSEEGRRRREEEQCKREEERKAAEARRAEQQKPREQSQEEKEARSAVDKALKVIDKFVNYSFNFYSHDEKSDLQEGIVAQCLLGGRDTTRDNMNEAVGELMDMVDGIAAQFDKSAAAMVEIVAGMVLPQVTPSGGGGGGPTGGWRGKRDDDWWRLWKPFFANFRSRGRGRH